VPTSYQTDRSRGTKDGQKQLAVLREKWPIAFPADAKDIRPLAISAAGELAAAMDWSLSYTLGVLTRWKMAPAYCKAVLAHDHRVALDGSPAEAIDANAKDLAAKQLARLAERETAKTAAKPVSPTPPKPKPAERPPEEAEQLRARVRASLMPRMA
jgi:sRNA-binding protein